MKEISESGMLFRFEDETCFPIETEKDSISSCRHSVMACECVVCPFTGKQKGKVLFIEAKSSAPNRANSRIDRVMINGMPMDEEHWRVLSPIDRFAHEISRKFIDSFSMWQSIHHGFHDLKKGGVSLPSKALKVKDGDMPVFVLIINNFKTEWLEPVRWAVESEFKHFMNAWNIRPTALKVVNPEMAKEVLGLDIDIIPE